MKLKAPDGWTGFFILGVEYNVDDKGNVEVGDGWAAHALIKDHGFTEAITEEPASIVPAAEPAHADSSEESESHDQ